jgi:hypothetical protein
MVKFSLRIVNERRELAQPWGLRDNSARRGSVPDENLIKT